MRRFLRLSLRLSLLPAIVLAQHHAAIADVACETAICPVTIAFALAPAPAPFANALLTEREDAKLRPDVAAMLASSELALGAGGGTAAPADGPSAATGSRTMVAPAPAPGIDFTGVWQTNVSSGIIFRMSLLQDAAGSVIGHFTPPNGTITGGAVVGNQLIAFWSQAGTNGRLTFTMAAGGDTFTGFFTLGDRMVEPDGADGAWHGTREVAETPITVDLPVAAEVAGSRVTAFATLSTNANVRAGPARTTRSLGTLPSGSTVPVVGCADRWCEVSLPGLPAAYIARSLLDIGAAPPPNAVATEAPAASRPIPAPPIPAAITAAVPRFGGIWATVTSAGERLEMVLEQSGRTVTGTYAPNNGTITGSITPDGRLAYRWSEEDGLVGMGVFEISRDGRTMSGTFSTSADPLSVAGSWFGTRQ